MENCTLHKLSSVALCKTVYLHILIFTCLTIRIHICSGIMSVNGQETPPYSSYEETYINNLRYCSEEAKKVGQENVYTIIHI